MIDKSSFKVFFIFCVYVFDSNVCMCAMVWHLQMIGEGRSPGTRYEWWKTVLYVLWEPHPGSLQE